MSMNARRVKFVEQPVGEARREILYRADLGWRLDISAALLTIVSINSRYSENDPVWIDSASCDAARSYANGLQFRAT